MVDREELGMEGQLSMLKGESKSGSPSPYLFMNTNLMRVFSTLCPTAVPYTKYNKSTIPLEVLAQIALCEREGYFNSIKVWYDEISPDPVVVGYIKSESHSETKHLIARFGDEVLPMEVLQEKAKSRLTDSLVNELKKFNNSAENFVNDFFSGKDSSVGFSINPVQYNHSYS